MTTITLSDQDSFTNFFKQFVAGDIADNVTIKFEQPLEEQKIPFLQIEGEGYNGTINASVMRALLIHQRNINRLYSLITYGKVQKLTPEEVKAIRVIFHISKGSSIVTKENIAEILVVILAGLTSGQTTAIIVIGLFLYFSLCGFKYYLDKDYNYKEKKLIMDAITKTKGSEQLIDGYKELLEKFTKLPESDDVVKYLGHPISPVVGKKDKINPPIQLNGNYKILRFNTKKKNYFEVRVENILTGSEFNARLSAGTNHENMQSIISKAYFSGDELYLNIDAFLSGNKISKARIVSIGEKITPSYQTTNN